MTRQKKINTSRLTEAKLIVVDNKIAKIIWMRRFIEAQGCMVELNVVYQDNQSTIKFENNGKHSSGKCTRYFDTKYFYITDIIERKEVTIKYCSGNQKLADYMTKPLVSEHFKIQRSLIMN